MIITRRGFGAGATALAAACVLGSAEAEGRAAAPSIDPATLVNPELRALLRDMEARMPKAALDANTLAKVRSIALSLVPTPLPAPPIVERMIAGPAGAPDVKVLVTGLKPEVRGRPAVLDIHGGGYVISTAWGDAVNAQNLALELDCVVVSVEYRLAPETRFPGSLEDNYAALRWIHANADELGVDRGRIAVLGGSAGGGHAAALAIAARDRGEIALCYQALIYPMLDDRTGSTRMPPPFIGTYMWSAADNRFGWSSLLGVPAGSKSVPRGAVPARVSDLSGLPPAFIGVGSLDLFVDEDVEYARRLLSAGVPVKLLVVPGAVHGFDQWAPQSRIAHEFSSAWKSELAAALAART